MYTIVVNRKDNLEELYQIDLFYDSITQEVIDMGTCEIPEKEII